MNSSFCIGKAQAHKVENSFVEESFKRSGKPKTMTYFPYTHCSTIMNILSTKNRSIRVLQELPRLEFSVRTTPSTHTLRTEMQGTRWLGVVKRCSPRLSPEVQGTPHLPSPTGLRGHTERVERRDHPACSSQPYQGQGHHVIMCE